MTTETILIKVREDGSRVVKRNLEDIGDGADKTARSLQALGTIMKLVASAAVLTALGRMADTYTTIQNKLRLVTTGTENLARVTKDLQEIANATRSDFEATSELYSRVAASTKDLGLSQKQLLGFTKSLNQAVVLSGASATEASGGLRQLAQGLAAGALRGDELNSVMENFPKVADIIAQSVGVTRGELRQMGADGKISAQIIIDAFAKASEQLDKEFATTVPTLGQAFVVMKNNILVAVGELDQSLGLTKSLAEGLLFVSENLKPILAVLGAVAAAMAIAFAPTVLLVFAGFITGTVIPAVKTLFALVAAHPFVALATAIAAVTTYAVIMRDEIKLGVDETTTLGDLMRAAWQSIGPILAQVADTVKNVWGFITDTVAGALNNINDNIEKSTQSQEAWWLKLVRFVAQVFDMIGGVIRGTMAGVQAVVMKVIAALMNNFAQLGNAIQGAMNLDGDAILSAVKSNIEGWKEAGTDLGGTFGAAFAQEQLSQADSGLESILDSWIETAKAISKERLAGAGSGSLNPGGANTIKPPIDEDAAKKAAKELERLKDALRGVMDEADPVGAATRRLAEAQDILTRSVKAGLIEQSKADAIYNTLRENMEAQLDPLGALNKELDKNIELLKLSSAERQIEGDLYMMTEQLKLTQDETAALRAKLIVEQQLAAIAQAKDSILQNSGAGQAQQFMLEVEAMKQLMADAASGFGMGDIAGQLRAMLPWANLEGTQEQMAGYVQLHADMYAQIKALEDASIINSQTAGMLRNQADQQLLEQRLNYTRQFFGALASLSSSENKKLARIGKAAAIVQATIDGVLAVQKTMSDTPYPYNIPLAAAQEAVAAANVAQIASTGFRTGGNMTVGGSGGPDSQLVAFRATPGEKVQVNTPAQARALEQGGGAAAAPPVELTVVNVRDPKEALDMLATPEGKNVYINMMAEDPAAFRQALNI